jgi:hypothetical protein
MAAPALGAPAPLVQTRLVAPAEPASLQRSLISTLYRLRSALSARDGVAARAQMMQARRLLNRMKPLEAVANAAAIGQPRRALEITRLHGLEPGHFLLPVSHGPLNDTGLERLLMVHGIEPQTIASARVRYLASGMDTALIAARLDAAEEHVLEVNHRGAQGELQALQDELLAPGTHVPASLRAADQIAVAGLLLRYHRLQAAQAALQHATDVLPLLEGEDEAARVREEISALTRRVEYPQEAPAQTTIHPWADWVDQVNS